MILSVQRRADASFTITARDADGALLDLTNMSLLFQAREQIDSEVVAIEKASGAGIVHAADQPGVGKGLATMTFVPADTATVAATLRWGLWLIDSADERHPLIEGGVLYVRNSVVEVV